MKWSCSHVYKHNISTDKAQSVITICCMFLKYLVTSILPLFYEIYSNHPFSQQNTNLLLLEIQSLLIYKNIPPPKITQTKNITRFSISLGVIFFLLRRVRNICDMLFDLLVSRRGSTTLNDFWDILVYTSLS